MNSGDKASCLFLSLFVLVMKIMLLEFCRYKSSGTMNGMTLSLCNRRAGAWRP